ncbi:MAG: spondin domain-containing protein [Planctomycetota bacterium]
MIDNIAPEGGVALTPVWVGFHNGNFDSYNGGLTSLEALERVAEDGDNGLISTQFNDFDPELGGYTFIDNSGDSPVSALVRTGDLSDLFRQDATLGAAPLLPGDSAMAEFNLQVDGSNDFFSYASMVLPTNDFFVANGNPTAHDLSGILSDGGSISFFIGTPEGGVNDAGTEAEDFNSSAGNPLFPGRNLPAGQGGPNEGTTTTEPIANVNGKAFADFQLAPRGVERAIRILNLKIKKLERLSRYLRSRSSRARIARLIAALEQRVEALEAKVIDVDGLDFNDYENGIGMVTIVAVPN